MSTRKVLLMAAGAKDAVATSDAGGGTRRAHLGRERAFGGYTIPSKIDVAWWYGTERYQDQVKLTIDWAELT